MSEPKLIVDGANALAEILAGIARARATIRIRAYMWRDDATGRQVLSALMAKIAENPKIRIYIEKDALGTRVYALQRLVSFWRLKGDVFSSDMGKQLLSKKDNVYFVHVWSRSVLLYKYLKENDHSKVFLFDEHTPGSCALIWGMNISDEYLTAQNHSDPDAGWRHDYLVSLHWELADAIAVPSSVKKKWLVKKIREGVEILVNLKNMGTIRQQILRELGKARHSVILEQAYITDGAIIRKLRQLARWGVQITCIIPDRSDDAWHANMRTIFKLLRPEPINEKVLEFSHKFKKFETPVSKKILSHLAPIPEDNLQVWLYHGWIHAKAILIDDSIAILGSANLTYGSFDFLNETNAIFRQKDGVVAQLSDQLKLDLAFCRRIKFETIPPHNRYIAWIQRALI